jgi:hypothetical protein
MNDDKSAIRLATPSAESATPLRDRAAEDLSFIRDTMERATAFTLVPGVGGVGMGITALTAAWFASRQESVLGWLAVWLAAATLALAIGLVGVLWKSRRMGTAIALRPARRFALSFFPALLVGVLLTVALTRAGRSELLPGVWLLTYGTGVIAGGTFSVPAIPIMGAGFLACGGAALFTPAAWGNIWMALGFGGLQVLFGTIIATRYGG